MIFPLRKSIKTLDGRDLTSLTVREYLTGGDVLASQRANKIPLEQTYQMIAVLTGLDLAEVLDADVRDLNALAEHVQGLLSDPKD